MLDYLWVFISRVLARGSAFFTLIALSMALTPEDLGEYGIFSTTIFFAVFVAVMGIRHASSYYLGKKIYSLDYVLSSVIFCSFISLLLVFSVIALLSFYFDYDIVSVKIIPSFMLVIYPVILLNMLQGILLGLKEVRLFSISEVFPRVISFFLVLVAWSFDFLTLNSAVLIFGIGYFFGTIYLLFKIFRKYDINVSVSMPSLSMFAYGFPFSLSLALGMALPMLALQLLRASSGSEQVGYFYTAYKLVDILSEASSSVGAVIFSRGVNISDRVSAIWYSVRIAKIMSFLMLFISILFFIILFLYMNMGAFLGYGDVIGLLMLLVGMLPFIGFNRAMAPAFAAQNMSFVCVIAGLLAIIFLLFAASGGISAMNLALVLIISRIISYVVFVWYSSSTLDARPSRVIFLNRDEIRSVALKLKGIF